MSYESTKLKYVNQIEIDDVNLIKITHLNLIIINERKEINIFKKTILLGNSFTFTKITQFNLNKRNISGNYFVK